MMTMVNMKEEASAVKLAYLRHCYSLDFSNDRYQLIKACQLIVHCPK